MEERSVVAVIDRYCSAWDEPDRARRIALLEEVWAPGGTYTDPSVHAAGLTALVAHIDTVIARFPGSRTLRASSIDGHHGVFRFAWKKVLADGTSRPEGLDIAELSEDGKLQRILGFFGPLAPMSVG